jgi:amino acid efflux transporter
MPQDPLPAATSGAVTFRRSIRRSHAVALYVSSVLGSGVLVLPGLAARLAGPASLVSWAILAGASVPLALTFSGLSARRPEAGGVYGFAREAFGVPAAATTGWLVALWSFTGGPAVALIAASYLGYAFPLTRPETFVLGFGLVVSTVAVNYQGVTLSSRVQLTVAGLIVALLGTVVLVASREVRPSNFQPFLPYGILPVGTAAALIFWSFLGYENVSSVAAEFVDPAPDFRRSVLWSVALVGALYLAVALVTVGTGAYRSGGGVAPFAAILGGVLGPYAAQGTALLALFIVFAVVNAYTMGMSRVICVAARDGAFPRALGRIDPLHRVPGRAMVFLLAGMSLVFLIYYVAGVDLSTALLVAGGAALLTYAIGSAAGLRLLAPGPNRRRGPQLLAGFSLLFSLALLPFVGWPVTVGLGGACLGYLYAGRLRRREMGSAQPP